MGSEHDFGGTIDFILEKLKKKSLQVLSEEILMEMPDSRRMCGTFDKKNPHVLQSSSSQFYPSDPGQIKSSS